MEDSIYESMGVSIDGELLVNYCAGRSPFRTASLTTHGASSNAVDFVTRLMLPDPKHRVTAASASESGWLSDIASRGVSELETHEPPQINVTKRADVRTHGEHEVPERASPSHHGSPQINFTQLANAGAHQEGEITERASLFQRTSVIRIIPPNPEHLSFITAENRLEPAVTLLKDSARAGPQSESYYPSGTPRFGFIEEPFTNPRQPPSQPPPATASTSMGPQPWNPRPGIMVPTTHTPSPSENSHNKFDQHLIL